MSAVASRRPRISPDFLAARRDERILAGLARCVVKLGYRSITVADIVSETGIARNTFYEGFGSRDAAAWKLLAGVIPTAEIDGPDGIADNCAAVMGIEIAARHLLGDEKGASEAMATAWHVVNEAAVWMAEPLELPEVDGDPLAGTLPPGRHGLTPAFVRANQRRRLLEGTAHALRDGGYGHTTVEGIVAGAAVSRRTFYEHFKGGGASAAVSEMVAMAEEDHGAPRFGVDVESGLGSLWAEIVAAMLVGDRRGAMDRRKGGEDILRALDEVIA